MSKRGGHRRPGRVQIASVAIWTAALAWPSAQRGANATSGGTAPVSAAVVATWMAHGEPSGESELDLMVLWRGKPGWFMGPEAGMMGSGSGSSGRMGPGGALRGPIVHHAILAGVELELEFDPQTRVARIQGYDVPLGDANVVLVDMVDQARESRIAGTLRIDPTISGGPPGFHALLGRSPELLDFLRCDAQLPDARAQQFMDVLCARIIGTAP